jgi:hypothetical protein
MEEQNNQKAFDQTGGAALLKNHNLNTFIPNSGGSRAILSAATGALSGRQARKFYSGARAETRR